MRDEISNFKTDLRFLVQLEMNLRSTCAFTASTEEGGSKEEEGGAHTRV